MWLSKGTNAGKKGEGKGLVAVAIDKEKVSQYALKWAIENLLARGRPVVLIHVLSSSSSFCPVGSPTVASDVNNNPEASPPNIKHVDKHIKDLFLTFHCFCSRKDIRCLDVVLNDTDIAKALIEYVNYAAIEHLVLGAAKGGFIRKLKHADIPTMVSKGAPEFCSVYVISKGKMTSVHNAVRAAPHTSPLSNQLESLVKDKSNASNATPKRSLSIKGARDKPTYNKLQRPQDDQESIRSVKLPERMPFGEFSEYESDISFVSSERTSIDRMSPLHYDIMDSSRTSRLSTNSEHSMGSLRFGPKCANIGSTHDFSTVSQESARTSTSSLAMDEVEAEMRRLRQELKQTMDLYSSACKEAVAAKQKALELHRWRLEEEKRVEEHGSPEEAAMVLAVRRKANSVAGATKRISEIDSERRISEEMKSFKEENGMSMPTHCVGRYRKYAIDEIEAATNNFSESRKIGEGGYGPVFKCYLDHTPVAVKVLRPDAAQGRTQFQQEVEVLSCIRHPNMVLLLGACPEYGCLIYEYMAMGSLEDRLFCKGKTPPLSWQARFRIAAEIATGLHFLHQTKPEPLVHRDLKPGNILLDQYCVSKIGDVGLARLVPPSVADNITQYRMTSTAGTFCYIDPEYQQTGMLGVKSDVYSLGVVLLQLLTAKPPMGLAHQISCYIEKGKFGNVLDPAVPDWPVEEALCMAKLAVKCAEMRRKDRPDLGKEVLPVLANLREFGEEITPMHLMFHGSVFPSSNFGQTFSSSLSQDVMSDPILACSATSSTKGPSTTSSPIVGE